MPDKGASNRSSVFTYIVLVYLLPLPILLLRIVDPPLEPLLIYAAWTPNIAAFLVLGLIRREPGGIRRLIAGWGMWRVGARWYVAALSPLFVASMAVAILRLLGGSATPPQRPTVLQLLSFLVLSIVTGAMGEELGWRGFLLPRLQQRFNALTSSLTVGLVWAIWHAPLWLLPGYGWDAIPYWSFALGAIASSVLFTWVLNNTGGSLVMASLMHLALNYGLGAAGILGLVPSPGDYWMVASLLYTLYAALLVLIAGPKHLSRALD